MHMTVKDETKKKWGQNIHATALPPALVHWRTVHVFCRYTFSVTSINVRKEGIVYVTPETKKREEQLHIPLLSVPHHFM
jgi:hypothetical protein